MRIERVDAVLRRGLHDHAPTALERAFKQIRQHLFDWLLLKVIE
jgi:hypothetical protein